MRGECYEASAREFWMQLGQWKPSYPVSGMKQPFYDAYGFVSQEFGKRAVGMTCVCSAMCGSSAGKMRGWGGLMGEGRSLWEECSQIWKSLLPVGGSESSLPVWTPRDLGFLTAPGTCGQSGVLHGAQGFRRECCSKQGGSCLTQMAPPWSPAPPSAAFSRF